MTSQTRTAGTPRPSEAPPTTHIGVLGWIRKNLFSSWSNALLTVAAIAIIYWFVRLIGEFVFVTADWTVIQHNLALFAIGQYPRDQAWRPIASLGVVLILGLASLIFRRVRGWPRTALVILWLFSPLMILFLLGGVEGSTGMPRVRTGLWSGLLLTLILTIVGIAGSFPLGILLALGRRSDMKILKWLCIVYIEVIRGVPLITILFMAQVMMPLFLHAEVDVVIRAMAGIIIFSSAYVAEIVRGGLAAIPNGQIEAAEALGLNPALVAGLIVMPQALRIAIPPIVGQFISLFKDTTLVSIVTLLDLLGIAGSALAQRAEFQLHKTELYLFLASVYFVISYSMSWVARRIESATQAMGGTHRL